jgi:hypothetical protein
MFSAGDSMLRPKVRIDGLTCTPVSRPGVILEV